MPQYADTIEQRANQHIPATPVLDPSQLMTGPELLQVFGEVIAAVRFLEGLLAGSDFRLELEFPTAVDGKDGDAWLNGTTGDLFSKVGGAWQPRGNLRGAASTEPGPRGPKGLDSTVAGPAGKSTYQLWLDAGNTGALAVFLAAQKGYTPVKNIDYTDGQDGNLWRWESFAPTTEPAKANDGWVHMLSATKFALYQYVGGATPWRVRFTSPDATLTTGGTGVVNSDTDIVVNDWVNADLTNVYNEANWVRPNNYYVGPPLSTGPYHEHVRVPSASTPGFVYKTVPVVGQSAPAVVRVPLYLAPL